MAFARRDIDQTRQNMKPELQLSGTASLQHCFMFATLGTSAGWEDGFLAAVVLDHTSRGGCFLHCLSGRSQRFDASESSSRRALRWPSFPVVRSQPSIALLLSAACGNHRARDWHESEHIIWKSQTGGLVKGGFVIPLYFPKSSCSPQCA